MTPADPRVTSEYPALGETATRGLPTPSRGGRAVRGGGLRLYAVAAMGHVPPAFVGGTTSLAEGTELVTFRDVGAVVVPAPYSPEPLTLPELDAYRAVVDALFATHAVVPAPPGTVFRSREALTGWLELHYFTLVEALNFVEGRVVARVTVTAAPTAEGAAPRAMPLRLTPTNVTTEEEVPDPAAPDIVSRAAQAFTVLRREAVSFLVLRPEGGSLEDAAHASFLVDRARWPDFEQAVAREAQLRAGMQFTCTGPWPPYDFVRMQFSS